MGKCQLTGALEPLLEWSRTGSEENVSAVPPSPDRNPRQPDGAAPDRPRSRSFGCGSPELAANGAVEIATIRTTGDRVQDRLLTELGGKGLFVKESQRFQLVISSSGRV